MFLNQIPCHPKVISNSIPLKLQLIDHLYFSITNNNNYCLMIDNILQILKYISMYPLHRILQKHGEVGKTSLYQSQRPRF